VESTDLNLQSQFPVFIRVLFSYFSIFQKARIKLTYIWPGLDKELGLAVHIDLVHLPVLHPVPQAHPSSAEATYKKILIYLSNIEKIQAEKRKVTSKLSCYNR
jgi:hypothetical protein